MPFKQKNNEKQRETLGEKNCKVKQEKIEEFMTVTKRSMVSNKREHPDKHVKRNNTERRDPTRRGEREWDPYENRTR
jgi:hypothetical protein